MENSQEAIFQGELRDVAVLFCDIRGFTPMSEELSPKEVVSFLNDYYTIMSEIVKQYNGSVNQFVGDEIFAAFGAPEMFPDNETNASEVSWGTLEFDLTCGEGTAVYTSTEWESECRMDCHFLWI